MSRPKKIKKPVRVSLVLEENQLKYLELMSLRVSYTEKKRVGLSELIRRCCETCYPLPKEGQMDLF